MKAANVPFLKALLRDPRVNGVGGLASAGMASSLIAVVLLPIVTRIYTPDQYAGYALALAASALLATVLSGRYEMACVVAPNDDSGDREAWKMARLALCLAIGCAIVLQIGIALAVATIASHLTEPTEVALLLLPLTTLAVAASSIQTLLDTRIGAYHTISLLLVARTAILCGLQILLGLSQPTTAGLLIPLVICQAPSLLRLLYLLVKKAPGPHASTFRQLAIRHKRYPQFQIWAAIANSLGFNLFVLALSISYDQLAVGLFAVASRIVLFPTAVITGPIRTVYFREASRRANAQTAGLSLYNRILLALCIAGCAIYLLIALVTPCLTAALGSDWSAAEIFIYASIPIGIASFIGAPANSALIVHGRQGGLLVWRLVLVASGPALILAAPAAGVSGAVAVGAASTGLLAATAAYAWWARRVFVGVNGPSSAVQESTE